MEAVRRASRGMLGSPESAPQARDSQDLEGDESQPLLRQRSGREFSQRQFRRAQEEAARHAAMESGWLTYLIIIVAFCIFAFWFFVNVKSWYVLFKYYDSPCDQPLSDWLLVKLVLDVLSSASQQRPRNGEPPRPQTWLILGLQNIWLIVGFHWCGLCKTCQSTSPELYNWVQFLVIFGTVVTLLLMLLPMLFYSAVILLVFLIGSGRVKNNNAAREDTLYLLEKVVYDRSLFADSSNPDDHRPAGDCCCCCEDFDDQKAIVRTPCFHYFHQECLAQWLKLAKTCPLCRVDLDLATEELRDQGGKEVGGLEAIEDPFLVLDNIEELENQSSRARSSLDGAPGSASGAQSSQFGSTQEHAPDNPNSSEQPAVNDASQSASGYSAESSTLPEPSG